MFQMFQIIGFGHKADVCTNKVTCSKCGKHDHHVENCNKAATKCTNCAVANMKFGLNLNDEHTAVDYNCPVYLRQIERRRTN